MKSVRTRILLAICLVVSSSMLALGGVSIFLNNWTTRGVLEQTMTETAEVASERVSHHLMVYKTIVESAGLDSTLSNPDATAAEKQHVIDALCEKNPDFTRGNILDTQGNSIFTGQNFSDREYFAHALKGETWVSEPLVSKVTNTTSVIVAAPIWENGDPSKNVTGVVYFVPTETFMNDIVASIKLSANAGAVILNKAGTVIAHPNADFVTNQNNSQENVKTDPSMAPIAALELEMISGKTGFGTYTMGGVEKFMGFAPIPDTDGWSLSVNAPTSDFMHYTNVSIIITIILFILFIAISAVIAVRISSGIGQPLKVLADILERIASTGNIHLDDESKSQTGKYIGRHDEVGEIATAVNNLIEILMVESKELLSIADGDLTSDIAIVSPEDTLGNAMAKMAGNLNTMFRDINSTSIQVSEGSRQIADGSQALAQGSTQQAAAIEQLSASISSIAAQTAQNAEMAKNAAGLSADIKDNAEKGNDQMNRMMQAVKEINDASQRISKVIAVIDSIAFQTNILALNAAVEAARAGQHGKGFAVVAEEVRNLATKSAEAASDTGALIADSMDKAQLGEKIAEETAASLREIVEGINKSTEIVEEIAHSSDEQAASIREINTGIDQVTQVVHQNSATSEESAAASQEMSSQSEVLQQLISQFKLKNS